MLFIVAKFYKTHSRRTLLTMISVLAVLSLLIYGGTTNAASRFYYLPSRFFEFAAGGILALSWKPQEKSHLFNKWFVYVCYVLLLALMVVNHEVIEANIKLVIIVSFSVILIMSGGTLENKVTANGTLARVGVASYSIFIWHQVILAFYRYSISNHFTVISYLAFIVTVAILSWLTYHFVEHKAIVWHKNHKNTKSKTLLYGITSIAFLVVTGYAGYIYQKGGVVRDIPELYISKNDKVDHKAYNDKIYNLDKPFRTTKRHWLIVGNSFGRDFANVILESDVSDSIELSYICIGDVLKPEYGERYKSADRIFLSSLGTTEENVIQMDSICLSYGFPPEKLVIVGTKNFGTSNGVFYAKRGSADYYEQRTMMEGAKLTLDKKSGKMIYSGG